MGKGVLNGNMQANKAIQFDHGVKDLRKQEDNKNRVKMDWRDKNEKNTSLWMKISKDKCKSIHLRNFLKIRIKTIKEKNSNYHKRDFIQSPK